jgi:hypothetical protein
MLQTAWIKRNQCHRNWLAHPDMQWVGVPLDQESLRRAIRMALRDHEEDSKVGKIYARKSDGNTAYPG